MIVTVFISSCVRWIIDYIPCMTNNNENIEQKKDETRMGGKYHGPSNVAGLTAREYWEMRYEEEDELERLRNDW